METIKVCRHPAASAHIGACVCVCVLTGAVKKYPTPEFALSWQGKCLIIKHGTQTRCAWFKCFSFFTPSILPFAEWAAVEMRDWFNKSLRGGGCRTAAAARSSLEPSEWFDARAAWGHFLLSSELHMAPHQEELNQRCRSPRVTLQQGQFSWIYLTWRLI